MERSFDGPAPGLLYASSKLVSPEQFSESEFDRWYEDIHFPDVFKAGGILEAWRWQSVDSVETAVKCEHSRTERPYLAFYPLQDFNYLLSDSFKEIPVEHQSIPGTHSVFDVANFDIRGYRAVHLFALDDLKPGQGSFLISAAFTPADDEAYEQWYRQEPLKEMSSISGWCKIERYELVAAMENAKLLEEESSSRPPKYLTLHYFEGAMLPETEAARATESGWAKKMMSTMKDVEIIAYTKKAYFSK